MQFRTRDELWAWLRQHHATSAGVWVRVGRSASALQSITFGELLEAGLAFGWSESKRRAYDADSYLQRFTPRRTVGTASERNLRIEASQDIFISLASELSNADINGEIGRGGGRGRRHDGVVGQVAVRRRRLGTPGVECTTRRPVIHALALLSYTQKHRLM